MNWKNFRVQTAIWVFTSSVFLACLFPKPLRADEWDLYDTWTVPSLTWDWFYADNGIYDFQAPWFIACGPEGSDCCHAPGGADASYGPLVHCDDGLGCDIVTDTCVKPCGGNGQVCCDGPSTRAPKWTDEGYVYSPNTYNMIEMCNTGACDPATRRCYQCGITPDGPCCPPDAAQATARCMEEHLECHFSDYTAESGFCEQCGVQFKRECYWGCDPGLRLRNNLCDICGADMQPPCDKGCDPGLSTANGLCRHCAHSGEIPCDWGCYYGLGIKNGLCAYCGDNNQAPCDDGCRPGLRLHNGICKYCGDTGQIPCEKNGQLTCRYPLQIINGVCAHCGAQGQVPCPSGGCKYGLVVTNGVCSTPPKDPPPAEMCSNLNETCVADYVPGQHCCKGGTPLLCYYGKCHPCTKHGEQCGNGNPWVCCEEATNGDSCVLDVQSATVICTLPDDPTPGKK